MGLSGAEPENYRISGVSSSLIRGGTVGIVRDGIVPRSRDIACAAGTAWPRGKPATGFIYAQLGPPLSRDEMHRRPDTLALNGLTFVLSIRFLRPETPVHPTYFPL